MKEALEQIRQTAGQLIAAADSEKAVDELRVRFLGKKGELTGILKQMGKLSAEERPVVGALANQVREDIDSQIRARMKELADAARQDRDMRLTATDWTQVLDAPIDAATRAAYRAYRQALRDVPEQDGFPGDIDWPEEPATVKADPDPVDEAFDVLVGGEADA